MVYAEWHIQSHIHAKGTENAGHIPGRWTHWDTSSINRPRVGGFGAENPSSVWVERNEEIIANRRARLGRFVLASNDKTLDGELMLQYYKGQNAVEKGFRFLKDKSFRVAEVYLKKKERIEALSMIMVLSLLIYSIAEWMLRKKLKETGETVSNQLGKPTQCPTLKWIFQKFRNINEAIIELKGSIHREIINLNEEQIKIIKLFGQGCEKYYLWRETCGMWGKSKQKYFGDFAKKR